MVTSTDRRRTFNGISYHHDRVSKSKKTADQRKKTFRSYGYLVRITKRSDGRYDVWYRA